MDPAKDPFDWVGKTIDDQFTVEEVVGEGGFAVVYRGHHKGFDEKVAIKALKFPAKLGEEERAKFLESFKAEGKLLRKLSSADAGIVQALDVGAATSPNGTWTPYLILEWLEGTTLEADLKARTKRGEAGRSLGDAIALLDPVARGLTTAHGMGVAHRDVKPANLFLKTQTTATGDSKNEKRSLKIVDFGIAKVMIDSEDVMRAYEATGESIHAFSPRYGAPEQFARKYGATGPWTDVFALALVVVEVVAGKSAMKGDTSQLMALATDGVSRPTLRSLGVMESDAVEVVLTRALAVEPVDRFADAGKFWQALRDAAAQGDTVLSERELAPTHVDGEENAKKIAAKSTIPPPTPKQRALQLAVAVALFGVGSAAIWSFIPHRGFSAAEQPAPDDPLHRMAALEVVPDAATPAVDPEHATMPSVSGYVRYVNDRYHFVIDVPNELTKFEGSSVGDGRIYKNEAGDAVLKVFGAELVHPFQDFYAQELYAEDNLQRWIFPGHTATPDMFALSGYDGKIPFIEKAIGNGGTYAELYFSYPDKDKEHFASLIPHMRDSFSFTAVSTTPPPPLYEIDAGMRAAADAAVPTTISAIDDGHDDGHDDGRLDAAPPKSPKK
ncbi:MAG: serine/threonine-protein kinase [Polyangiaceae bacterium]